MTTIEAPAPPPVTLPDGPIDQSTLSRAQKALLALSDDVGELVDDQEHERCPGVGGPGGGTGAAELVGAGADEAGDMVEQVDGVGPVVEDQALEQVRSAPEFHAALGIDAEHLDLPGGDSRGEVPQQRPHHRRLPGPGGADDEEVVAEQAGVPRPSGLDRSDRHLA